MVALVDQGGGLASVAWGAWVSLAGAEVVAIAVALLGVLGAVVWGLEIEESSRFVSFLVSLVFVSAASTTSGCSPPSACCSPATGWQCC